MDFSVENINAEKILYQYFKRKCYFSILYVSVIDLALSLLPISHPFPFSLLPSVPFSSVLYTFLSHLFLPLHYPCVCVRARMCVCVYTHIFMNLQIHEESTESARMGD